MTRMSTLVGLVIVATLTGCAGDMAKQLHSNAEMRDQVMGAIATHSDLAGAALDRMLAADSSRNWVFDKVTSGDAAQAFMLNIARDRTKLDGIVALAMQDSSMKEHLLTLFRGAQMVQDTR